MCNYDRLILRLKKKKKQDLFIDCKPARYSITLNKLLTHCLQVIYY